MGAGKTEVGARWKILRAILQPDCESGCVAPTQKRLKIVWSKILRLLDPSWVADVRLADQEIILVNGHIIQFVAAKIYSADVGSPIQGYDWVDCLVDEEQDCEDSAMADVAMRGRVAGANYSVLTTCTLKDTPQWRERKQRYISQPSTTIYQMAATANPFIDPEYWENLRQTLTEREYRMRVLAEDARPERSVYPDFMRETHVRTLPELGIRNVTPKLTGGYDMLIGHDPGSLCDVSVLLRAYEIKGESGPVWFVIDELTTEQSTSEYHAHRLLELLQTKWHTQLPGNDEPKVLIRADPYGNTETRPHVTVYREFANVGFKIKAAEYNRKMSGPGSIPKEARIGVVNTLLRNAAKETRLYFAAERDGNPTAKKLVAAIEMSERDEAGKAESEKKNKSDLSHWPAAMGYALWWYERTKVQCFKEYKTH